MIERTRNEKKEIANALSNFAALDGKVWLISPEATVKLEKKSKEKLAYDIVRTVLNRGVN